MHIGQFNGNTVIVFGDNLHTLWQCGGNRRIACPLRQVLCYNCTHRSPLCNTSHTVTYTIICTAFYNCRNTLVETTSACIAINAFLHWVEYLANTQSHHGASVVQNDMRPGWLNYLQFPTISSSPLLSSGDTSSSCHRNKVILAMQPPSFPFQSAAPLVRPRSRLLRRGEV